MREDFAHTTSCGRRDFLRVGSLSCLGISLSHYLQLKHAIGAETVEANQKAQSCILLWLNGGPSQVDTWDPKSNSSFKSIGTNVLGTQISELLPRTANQMHRLSIVRSMSTPENNHGVAHHYAMTGHRPSPAMKFPSLGSIITKETGARKSVPPYVMLPEPPIGFEDYFRAHFLGAEYNPLKVPDPSVEGFKIPDLSLPESLSIKAIDDRRTMLELVDRLHREKVKSAQYANLDIFRQQALNMIISRSVREAFDLSQESDKTKDAYGRDTFGQSALIARRLVEAGSRFVSVLDLKRKATRRDWDTHGRNDSQHRDHLVPVLDRVLDMLLSDLAERGLLETTIVLVMGEFGRTYDLNPRGGRDHWCHCWSLAVGGGGIRGGQIVGASDERGAYVADRRVSIGDLYATIYKAFGIDWTTEYLHPIGRPLKIANSTHDETGVPIKELI